MAYIIDPLAGDIVIGGFDAGVAPSPYGGLTDMRSVAPTTVPGEVSVAFSTESVTKAPKIVDNTTGTLITTSGGLFSAPSSLLLENNQYITFSNLGGAVGSGLATGTPYLLFSYSQMGLNEEWQLYTTGGTLVTVTTASTTTVTFSTISPTKPKYFASMNYGGANSNFMIDDVGNVWTDYTTTTGAGSTPATHSWTWAKNTTDSTSHGNGMGYFRTLNNTRTGDWDGWLFIFRDGQIDYSNVNGVNNGSAYNNVGTWSYGWNPSTGTTGNSNYLQGAGLNSCPHPCFIGEDGTFYYGDHTVVAQFYQSSTFPTIVDFVPTTSSSYSYQADNLVPNDTVTCIAPLGTDLILGGINNLAYTWNTTSPAISTPIYLPEAYVANIITVNTNAYIFCGNRGNIYVTNGSQANIFVKIPDHISGTVQPYFEWGGATYNQGRLYFSFFVTSNAGSTLNNYGGVWAIDINTQALWLSNQLSYASYDGYASALYSIPSIYIPNSLPSVPGGYGLFIGWVNGSTYGIDSTISTPYTSGVSWVTSDIIPVGIILDPITPAQIEFKLSTPLATGETIEIQVGDHLDMSYSSFTSVFTTTGDGSLISAISNEFPLSNLQWLLVRVILTSTSSSPSYCRVNQIRVHGATSPTHLPTQPFALQ